MRSVAYSLDGRFVGAGSDDGNVRLWDAATGFSIALLVGHRDWVRSVAFAPDGRSVVSCSDGKTIRFWDRSQASGASPASDGDPKTPLHSGVLEDG